MPSQEPKECPSCKGHIKDGLHYDSRGKLADCPNGYVEPKECGDCGKPKCCRPDCPDAKGLKCLGCHGDCAKADCRPCKEGQCVWCGKTKDGSRKCCGEHPKAEAKEDWSDRMKAKFGPYLFIGEKFSYRHLGLLEDFFRAEISKAKLEGARGCRDAVRAESHCSDCSDRFGNCVEKNWCDCHRYLAAADSHVEGMEAKP